MKNLVKRPLISRSELISRLSDKGYTKYAATLIWRDVVSVLEEAFIEGNDVMFAGFGTFHIRDHKERESNHPATKERIVIPAHRTVVFVPGRKLKDELAVGFVRK